MNTGSITRLSRFTLAPALTALLLAGCNSESGSNGGSEANLGSLGTTKLTLSFAQTKLFKFEWQPVSGVTHYRLDEKVNKTSGYVTVADNIDKNITHYELTVPLYDRTDAQYTLNGCINQKCTPLGGTAVAVVDPAQLVNSIGYVKGFAPDGGDPSTTRTFGDSIALSEDGTRLAVGAPGSGIGPEGDNLKTSAGLVFVYRLDADGNWKEEQRLIAPNPDTSDSFGSAVSLSGDGNILVIGAPNEGSNTTFGRNANSINEGNSISVFNNTKSESGAVYVYTRGNSGIWNFDAYIKSDIPKTKAQFGAEVSLSNDGKILAIAEPGNPNQDGNEDKVKGSVFIYTHNKDKGWLVEKPEGEVGLSNLQIVQAINGEIEDVFGSSVSLNEDGTLIAIGADEEENSTPGIVQIVGEDTLTVGEDNQAAEGSGAVYLFARKVNESTWNASAYIKAKNPSFGDSFGNSVSLSADGNTLAVGAFLEDFDSVGVFTGDAQPSPNIGGNAENQNFLNSGAVYIFSRPDSNSLWVQEAFIKASNAEDRDSFGISVSLSADGKRLAVGAFNEDSLSVGIDGQENNGSEGKNHNSGAAYIYRRDETTGWQTESTYIKASNTSDEDLFGQFVVISGDGHTLAVGASQEDSNATGINGDQSNDDAPDSGAVYLY